MLKDTLWQKKCPSPENTHLSPLPEVKKLMMHCMLYKLEYSRFGKRVVTVLSKATFPNNNLVKVTFPLLLQHPKKALFSKVWIYQRWIPCDNGPLPQIPVLQLLPVNNRRRSM